MGLVEKPGFTSRTPAVLFSPSIQEKPCYTHDFPMIYSDHVYIWEPNYINQTGNCRETGDVNWLIPDLDKCSQRVQRALFLGPDSRTVHCSSFSCPSLTLYICALLEEERTCHGRIILAIHVTEMLIYTSCKDALMTHYSRMHMCHL